MTLEAKRCSRCLYDQNTPAISFDDSGVCSYCRTHERLEREYPTGDEGERRLQTLAAQIKSEGRNRQYDCVVGISGGCDSSYMLYLVKERLGLRPLAVHFDNTWDSTIAVENIHNLLQRLGVDLYTYVVDNVEYDDIYRAFMRAGVPDVDIPTDIALASTLYMAAARYGVRYTFEGHSFRTEGISPLGWAYMDARYIASVHRTYGSVRMKTFPNLWLWKFLYWAGVKKIKKVRPLYYVDYQKEETKALLARELGWRWYGGHHLENRFTAFCHSYLMPRRFGRDLRALGYSALIRSGQMTQAEGLRLLEEPHHLEPEIVDLVKKRLGFGDTEFERMMNLPHRTYREFRTYKKTFERLRWLFYLMWKADLIPQSFYMKYTRPDPLPVPGGQR
ncbi:MAG: N-acetyl sugar amidotransferase [Acidobacteriota bacterium]